jgi:hypothetical protein
LELFINGEKIDYTLEKEKNLGDLYVSLVTLFQKEGCYMSEFMVDGQDMYPDKPGWQEKKIDTAGRIEVVSLGSSELRVSHLSTVLNYFRMVLSAVDKSDVKGASDLLSEYPWVIKNLPAVLDSVNGELITNRINELMMDSGLLAGKMPDPDSSEMFVEEMTNFSRLLEGRIREIEDPRKEGANTIQAIQFLLPQAEEVSLLLQTGKDREAMNLIIQLVELLQKIIRIFRSLERHGIRSDSFSHFAPELVGILGELEDAFRNEDSVLIGDLVEYELVPRLKKSPEFFNDLKEVARD